MIGIAKRLFDNFRGAGDAALTVPPLDGSFRPNAAIEAADIVYECVEPDNLTVAGNDVFLSSGGALLRLDQVGGTTSIGAAGAAITATAGRADGMLAVARSGGAVSLISGTAAPRDLKVSTEMRGDVTAMAFLDARTLVVAIGAQDRSSSEWARDLMEHGRSGSLWLLDIESGSSKRIAKGLRYPSGICVLPGGQFLVSASWDYTLKRFDASGSGRTVLANLPGYPWRIAPAGDGGFWLCFAAIRNQLVEFVLKEDRFRRAMVETISPEHWIGPTFRRSGSPLDPVQEGGQKVSGAIKPWAPSLSYGLIARIDADFLPQESHHSRADGRLHGVTSVVQQGRRLLATSRGGGAVVGLAV